MDVSLLLQSAAVGYLGYYVYCQYDPIEANRPMHYYTGLAVGGLWYYSGMRVPVLSRVTDTIATVV